MTGPVATIAVVLSALLLFILGVRVVVSIMEEKNRRNDTYRFYGSIKYDPEAKPDLLAYPVKVSKVHKGYRLDFLARDSAEVVYSITMKSIDHTHHR